jgi:hypothetical protein
MADSLQTMRAFRASTELPVMQLEPPPPLPRHRVLAYPREVARATLFRKHIAPERIRYKLWRLEADIFRRFCAESDIAYLPAPTNMIDTNGMLAEGGWGSDATHANSRYGIEAVKDVLDLYLARTEEARITS